MSLSAEREDLLNGRLQELLSAEGIPAEAEVPSARHRLDVKVFLGEFAIVLEAKTGFSASKKQSARKDALARLEQDHADAVIAVCYPANSTRKTLNLDTRLLVSMHATKNWVKSTPSGLAQLIRRLPHELGDPDRMARSLSDSLDLAVERLTENQSRELATALDYPEKEGAKRAMLVIASAAMFHARLDDHLEGLHPIWDARTARDPGGPAQFTGTWPPVKLQDALTGNDLIASLDEAWNLILALDYKPVFETARAALAAPTQSYGFSAAVRSAASAGARVVRSAGGARHDLLGRIFHRVLGTARNDGSYYTSSSAAALLAGISLSSECVPEELSEFKVIDPACGTGTLLMAVAERVRDLRTPETAEEDGRTLIESVLTGLDVNLTACHLAATTLGLLSPTVTFDKMGIHRVRLGVEDDVAHLGSLELLARGNAEVGQMRLLGWPQVRVSQIDTGAEADVNEETPRVESANLVIMNPPFTRDSLRHDQFSRAEEKLIKDREKLLMGETAAHLSGNSGPFIVLGERLADPQEGTLAAILPLSAATAPSGLKIRMALAEKFWIEKVVTSHDPLRIAFSENTNISEMMVVCRRWDSGSGVETKPPTEFFNLAVNSDRPTDAISLAERIYKGDLDGTEVVKFSWPAERMAEGDWSPVRFYSPYLVATFEALKSGALFSTPIRELGEFAEVGPAGRRVRDVFARSEVPTEKGWRALWNHDADTTQSLRAETDCYVTPKSGEREEKLAYKYWKQRSNLLISNRISTPTSRVVSVRLEDKVLGSAWVPANVHDRLANDLGGSDKWEKAMCVWLNSTFGILGWLGCCSTKKLVYPQIALESQRALPTPVFNRRMVLRLSQLFEEVADRPLKRWADAPADETRKRLDFVLSRELGCEDETVARVRWELSLEPSVTNQRKSC